MKNELIEKKFDLAIANMKLDILKDMKEHLFLDKDRYVPYNDSSISTFKEFQRFAKTKSRCS